VAAASRSIASAAAIASAQVQTEAMNGAPWRQL
jgi:hypothetical protein